ncbi:MAG: aldose 1-epimerase [Hyphomicrobiales bacterium]|nr:aldose 1-epimerase [Hyphomicrobiales bacterium]MBV8440095.1 aldose 1-epimerase [Hyphomicrobiales bacterium]
MAAPRLVTLADGVAEATVAPDLGGGLASYDLVGANGRAALFRPCRDLSQAGPFDLANNLLVPWSNRISGGGFYFGGRFHPLEPNLPGEPYPIHGNGFSSPWSVESAAAERVELLLTSNGPGPFCYIARATYELDRGALTMGLRLRNLAAEPLPFGLGFHPWLVRTPVALLQAKAERVVLENSGHLPAGEAPVASHAEWNFASPRALPAGWINNAFLGWDGRAAIVWPDRKLALDVEADAALSTYIVFSPAAGADFFCFEPVSHPVDAHNLPRGPEANGLTILAPQETMFASCRFRPRRLT